MLQGFQQSHLKSSFCKIRGRYNNDLVSTACHLGQRLHGVFRTNCVVGFGTLIPNKGFSVYLVNIYIY
jgi:hypothetical protein